MAQTPEAVLKDLKQKKYAPVYFLQGDEPFYIDKITAYIEENVLKASEKGFNQVVMYGKDVNMENVMVNAKRYPMMSDKQVVIVKEAQDIQDIAKEQGQKLLDAYLKNPLPSTILVFAHKYKSIGRNKTLGKIIDQFAVMVNSKKLYDYQLPEWIQSYIDSKGFTIDQKARHMLAENIGNNLERLSNEIDKMLINLKEKVTIDEHLIQKYIGISKDYNIFELQKAISYRNVFKANQIVTYFAANPKEHPLILTISSLFSYFSKLLVLHHSKDKSEAGLSQALSVNKFFIKEYIQAGKNFPLPKVINNIHYLRQADLRSKGVHASLDDSAILKELIFKLLH